MRGYRCTGKIEDCLKCTLPDCIRPALYAADSEIIIKKEPTNIKEKKDRKEYQRQYYQKKKMQKQRMSCNVEQEKKESL